MYIYILVCSNLEQVQTTETGLIRIASSDWATLFNKLSVNGQKIQLDILVTNAHFGPLEPELVALSDGPMARSLGPMDFSLTFLWKGKIE